MEQGLVERLLADHGVTDRIERCERLVAGYSDDEKWVVWADGAPAYLLRLSARDMLARRKAEFDAVAVHYERGVLCPRPLAFGETLDGTRCFSLLEYIVGESAETALPKLPERACYEIGVQTGRELYRMHQLEGDETSAQWFERRLRKHERYMAKAEELSLTYPGCERVERFIDQHVELLRSSPVRFQHDDLHPANLIIEDGRLVGVIDFNRCDWGDPIEDFYKVPFFGEPVSRPYANGQIDGYLACEPVAGFWPRYNLFLAMMLLPSVVWMHFHPPSQGLGWWMERVVHMAETHDFEGNGPPAWYVGRA
ncbi:MAG: aminoglycoside phosphotransferase family protein [Verrucomicrobia bacterium]|nr:aminoglycoside phosphotransferase family protein [Verrucomicrobiota bacterium]